MTTNNITTLLYKRQCDNIWKYNNELFDFVTERDDDNNKKSYAGK